jgi:hypothetical protein
MYYSNRKINIVEEVLKIDNENTLAEIEGIISKSKSAKKVKSKKSWVYDFVGVISKKDAAIMEKAINETCETINPDDWK